MRENQKAPGEKLGQVTKNLGRGMMNLGQSMMMGLSLMGHGMGGMMGHGMCMRVMMVLMDTDGDGTLSLEEFQTAHAKIFKAIDADKDGKARWRRCRCSSVVALRLLIKLPAEQRPGLVVNKFMDLLQSSASVPFPSPDLPEHRALQLRVLDSGDLALVGGEGRQDFGLLTLRDLEEIQGPSELRCDLIKFFFARRAARARRHTGLFSSLGCIPSRTVTTPLPSLVPRWSRRTMKSRQRLRLQTDTPK